MAAAETGRMGRRGTFVIPASLRRRFGLDEGTLVIAEERPDGILLRPAVAVPIARYTREQQAVYLLENAVDAADYAAAREAVQAMGLEPDEIPHEPPVSGHRKRRRTPRRA